MNVTTDNRIQRGMERQFDLLRQRENDGARRIGWKVGFGAPAAKEKLGIAGPLIGFLLDRAVLRSGATASLTGWTRPVAEPEIAIEMASDVDAGCDPATIPDAIASIGPAIELADLDIPPDDVEAILAGDIFQRHVIFGPRRAVPLPGGLSTISGTVTRSDQNVPVPSDLETNTGRLIDIVQHVAGTLAALGLKLRAGDVIIAGCVTPPLVLDLFDTKLEWTLAPIGAVSVQFTR